MKRMKEQSLRQRQTTEQRLGHKTKPQQVLEARLLEMTADGIRQRIDEELVVNPYLVADATPVNKDKPEAAEKPEPQPDADDEPPLPQGAYEGPERQIAATATLYDHLMAQLADYDLTPRQRQLATYLIGCIDGDGKLDSSLAQIADDLYINHDIDTTEDELAATLAIVQQFDPAGIAGRTTQECLLLEARRLTTEPRRRVFTTLFAERNYEAFTHQRWDQLQAANHFTDADMALIRRELRRFDPYPARSFGPAPAADFIRPDFEVTLSGGRIQLTLNEGDLPRVTLDDAELDAAARLAQKAKQAGAERVYRGYAESGRLFVEALRQRRATLLATMKAIIALQRDFFREGDASLLRPMMLEDVAARTGQDISTVSRATRGKYVMTPYGTYPLKWFFTQKAKRENDDVSVREVLNALADLVAHEPNDAPLGDQALALRLAEMGYRVARRTVVKYRGQLGIPIASIRKRALK